MTVTRYVLGLMLALALLLGLRLPFLRCEPFIPGTPLLFDEKDYIRGAKAMPVGDTSVDTNEAWIRAPGTSWALLTVARLRGVPVELAGCDFQRAQVGLWAVMLLLVASIAGMLFGRGAALATALLFAITPISVAVTLMLHADTLFCTAQVAAVWALLVYARRPHLAWPVAAGLLAGLAALVRSPILPLLPLLALWVTLDSWRRLRPAVAPPEGAKPRWRAVRALGRELRAARALTLCQALRVLLPGILLLACAAAVIAPWTIRNYRLYGGFIPSDTTGAVNLLDNNAPKGYSTFNRIRAASDNPAERQRFATSQALAFIRADLPGFARKVAYASWLAWSPDSFRRTWDFWTALTERPLVGALFAQLTVLLWPTIALAMLGLLFAPHAAAGARGYRAVMLMVVLYYTLTIGVTHFEERYRMPFLLLWMPYAGWCLAHPRALIGRLRRAAGVIAVVVAVALAISYAPQIWPLQWQNARALALHARGLIRAQSGDPAGALEDQRAAAALQPDLLEAYVAAGELLAQQGDQAGAEQALRVALAGAQAVKLRPPADATVALQRLLRAQGRLDDSANLDSDLSLPARRRAEALAWRRGAAPAPSLRLGADDLGLVRGFYSVDRQHAFRWSAPQASLLLAGQGDYVCLSVNAGRPPDVPAPLVTLAARPSGQAQVEIGQLRPPRNGWAWLCARLPAPADGEVEITLRATAYNPLAHGVLSDPRDLGVNVQEAALRSGPLAIDGASGLLLDQPATAEPAQALQLIGISGAARGRPGEQVPLTIWWRGAQPPPAGAFTFLHVLDAAGQTVASYNAPLAADQRPQPWAADEPLLDYATIPLPATLAPGRYRLIGGAFDPASGAQLAKAELGELVVEGK